MPTPLSALAAITPAMAVPCRSSWKRLASSSTKLRCTSTATEQVGMIAGQPGVDQRNPDAAAARYAVRLRDVHALVARLHARRRDPRPRVCTA